MLKVTISDDMAVTKNGYFLGWITHGFLGGKTIWRVGPTGSAGWECNRLNIPQENLDFATQKDAFEYLTGERVEFVSNGLDL